ncbi:MAG: pitrilysin family protein [Pseudomonadota bacterium]|nr:pitrilysin family protein [Pseudomonadota bacterium]
MKRDMRKRKVAGILVLVLLIIVVQPVIPAESQQETGMFEVDGLRVIFKPVAGETVGVQLFFDGGVTKQTEENQGIDAFLMSASMRGSEKYPKDKLISELTKMGTAMGTDASYDYTTAYIRSVKKNFESSWDIFVDLLSNPLLEESEVELVRSQLISAARQKRDSPDSYVFDLANSMLYEGHPYALDPYGVEESLRNITIEDLRDHNGELLTKSRMLLVIVGDFTQREVERYASAFASLPEGEEGGLLNKINKIVEKIMETSRRLLPRTSQECSNLLGRAETEEKFTYAPLEIPNTYVRGVFRAPGMDNPDYYAACIALDILSDTLFEEVRTKRNMAYSVSSGLSSRRDNYGVVAVTTNTPDEALNVMKSVIEEMKIEGVSAERVEEAVNGYITSFYLSNENTLSQAYQLGLWELNGGGWEKSFEFVDNLRKIKPEDVKDFLNTYVKDITTAAVGGQSLSVKL